MKHVGPDRKLWEEPSYEAQEREITPGRIFRLLPCLCRRNIAKMVIRNREVCAREEGRGKRVGSVLWRCYKNVDRMWVCFATVKEKRGDSAELPKLAFVVSAV